MILNKELMIEIKNDSNINNPTITLGLAPIARQIAISRLLSLRFENKMAAIPIKVVKITTTEIPNKRFSKVFSMLSELSETEVSFSEFIIRLFSSPYEFSLIISSPLGTGNSL